MRGERVADRVHVGARDLGEQRVAPQQHNRRHRLDVERLRDVQLLLGLDLQVSACLARAATRTFMNMAWGYSDAYCATAPFIRSHGCAHGAQKLSRVTRSRFCSMSLVNMSGDVIVTRFCCAMAGKVLGGADGRGIKCFVWRCVRQPQQQAFRDLRVYGKCSQRTIQGLSLIHL